MGKMIAGEYDGVAGKLGKAAEECARIAAVTGYPFCATILDPERPDTAPWVIIGITKELLDVAMSSLMEHTGLEVGTVDKASLSDMGLIK